jgi:hypothetical protein
MNSFDTYWDPLGEKISTDTYKIQTQKLVEKTKWYRDNPFELKRNQLLFIFIPLCIALVYFLIFRFEGSIIPMIIFAFAPVLLYRSSIQSLQENMILFLMTQENNWVYLPDIDSDRYDKYQHLYPSYFNVGHSQYIEDQIWGTIPTNKPTQFWNCSFTYETGSGKSRQTHHHNIFILHLYKPVPVNFDLKKKSALSLGGNNFKTESEEFNRTFSIQMDSDNPDSKLQLLRVLSPSVQVRLTEIATTFRIAQIGFYGTRMILDFKDDLWNFKYTNFFKEVRVDERDTEYFKNLLLMLTQIPIEMLHYID